MGNLMKIKKVDGNVADVHTKGWGFEVWIENIPEYCGKLLHFKGGKKCSMHFHLNKTETMFLASGRIDIDLIDPETAERYTVSMFKGDSLRIPRGQLHQIHALLESDLYEFSTMHEDSDSYRAWKGD